VSVTATALAVRHQTRYHNGNHGGIADTCKDGAGGSAGMRPHELLEAALATCMTMTARMASEAIGVDHACAAVTVRLARGQALTTVRYRLALDPRLDADQRATVIARVECSPVLKTLQLPLVLTPVRAQG